MGSSRENLKMVVSVKDQASKKLKNIAGSIVAIGGAYIGMRAVVDSLTAVIEAAALHEKVWNDVAASLERHNFEIEKTLINIKDYSDQLQTLTGISDEVIGTSIQTFIDFNNDLATSFDLVKVAADLAAGGHMDMRAAVDLVGKASVGYTGTLSRYGIIIDESIPSTEKFAEAIRQINQRFGGAAEARMKTYAGQTALLKERFGDLQESIGKLLLPSLTNLTKALSSTAVGTAKIIETFSDWLDSSRDLSDVIVTEIEPGTIEYAKAVERLNEAFNAGALSIGDYRIALQGIGIVVEASSDAVNEMTEQIINQANMVNDVSTRILSDFSDVMGGLNQAMVDDVKETFKEINEIMAESEKILATPPIDMSKATQIYLDFVAEIDAIELEQTENFALTQEERTQILLNNMEIRASEIRETNDKIAADYQRMNDKMEAALGSATKDIVRLLFGLEKDAAQIFKNMAMEFLNLFIEETLRALARKWAPRFLGFLGGMFDTPANDRMAMQQGEHFAFFFMQGAEGKLRTANFGATITAAITKDFISREIVPVIEEDSIEGSNRIPVFDSNMTGKADITFS